MTASPLRSKQDTVRRPPARFSLGSREWLHGLSGSVDDSGKASIPHTLTTEYGTHLFRGRLWAANELRHVLAGVEDLATLMGGPARFRSHLGRVLMWRAPFRSSMAAMGAPLVGVVYFKGASWGDVPEFKWQTVH